MVVAAEIHTATHFCVWKIVILTAKCPHASTFASRLYQVHHSCRGLRIQTSYWSIMMSGRVKLPTTIDRRRVVRIGFPSLSLNSCYVMCSLNMQCSEPVIGGRLSPSAARLEYKNHRSSFTLMYDLHSWQTNRFN